MTAVADYQYVTYAGGDTIASYATCASSATLLRAVQPAKDTFPPVAHAVGRTSLWLHCDCRFGICDPCRCQYESAHVHNRSPGPQLSTRCNVTRLRV